MKTTTNRKTQKQLATMRFKPLKDGRQHIYLDIYKDGKRKYEYLKLYLLPESDEGAKKANVKTMKEASAILKTRIRELKKVSEENKHLKKDVELPKDEMLLLDWIREFEELQRRRGVKGAGRNKQFRISIQDFGRNPRLKDIDKSFCLAYIDFLRGYTKKDGTDYSVKTKFDLFECLNNAINTAIQQEILTSNPINKIDRSERIRRKESQRDFLTIDEVKRLIATPCDSPEVQQAYLFACSCGLRLGDVLNLKWKDISEDNGTWRASILMLKSQRPLYIPLGEQARKWMPEQGEDSPEDNVFKVKPHIINDNLQSWAEVAGITNKKVTFHTSRHTFATMLLTLGADIYTVSKLLGHTSVKTTQIYAKIIDQKKDDAVSLVDDIFD
jgi:integrase